MNNKSICIAALFISCVSGSAYASEKQFTLRTCVEVSSEMNKNVPVVIDKYTMSDTTFCTPGRFKPTLHYRASMAAPRARLNNFRVASIEMRRLQTNSWCTEPNQLKLLQQVDVLNVYYDRDRKFIGQIPLRLEDCLTRR